PKMDLTVLPTLGIHIIPPTKITLLISLALIPASFKAFLHGSRVDSMVDKAVCNGSVFFFLSNQ
ncbi:hypothetical protein SCLCIDRAFT_115923, partial [Scleroderma citrinum Foug A]